MKYKSTRCAVALAFVLSGAIVGFTQVAAPMAHYTATTANTSSSGEAVRFDLLRWSTDAERDQLFAAITATGDTAAVPGVLQKATAVGYIWTTESAGYTLRYAYRIALPDGGERIILATDRLVGSFEPQRWKLAGSLTPMEYTFTVIELRLPRAGMGEGKASLAAKVIADKEAKSISLDNYSAAPVLFQGVRK